MCKHAHRHASFVHIKHKSQTLQQHRFYLLCVSADWVFSAAPLQVCGAASVTVWQEELIYSLHLSSLKKGKKTSHLCAHMCTLSQCPQGISWWGTKAWGLSAIMKSGSAALLALQVILFIPLLTETLSSNSPALRTERRCWGGRGSIVVVQGIMGNGATDPWR